MDIAKERGYKINQILSHDVLSVSPIFNGTLPTQANKSKLVEEIEHGLDSTQWREKSSFITHVVVDFMSKFRKMPLPEFPTLGTAINAAITSSSSICLEHEFIHFVFDSYIEMSLKEGERMRRSDSTSGIDIIGMNKDTPIPKQLDKFWASDENKKNLQMLAQNILHSQDYCGTSTIITSSVVLNDEVLPAYVGSGEAQDLWNWIEEADSRLVVHVEWAVRVKQCKKWLSSLMILTL